MMTKVQHIINTMPPTGRCRTTCHSFRCTLCILVTCCSTTSAVWQFDSCDVVPQLLTPPAPCFCWFPHVSKYKLFYFLMKNSLVSSSICMTGRSKNMPWLLLFCRQAGLPHVTALKQALQSSWVESRAQSKYCNYSSADCFILFVFVSF